MFFGNGSASLSELGTSEHLVTAADILAERCQDVEGAKRLVARLETMDNAGPQPLASAASILAERFRDVEGARRLLARLGKMDNAGPEHLLTAAGILAERCRDVERAKSFLERAVHLGTQNWVVLLRCAEAFWSWCGDTNRAAALFEQARGLQPRGSIILVHSALFELVCGYRQAGERMLRQAISRLQDSTPRYTNAYAWLMALAMPAQPEAGEALTRIKQIITSALPRTPIPGRFLIVTHLAPQVHLDRLWLEMLTRVIAGQIDPAALNDWPKWRDAP